MGKQIAVAMTRTDEALFLEFLRSIADIRILRTRSPSKESLVIDDFSKDNEKDNKYYIWNRSFPWDMETGRMTGDESGKWRNWYYIKDFEAPLIEYVRHNFEDERLYGRIYWSKYFAATEPLKYDVKEFEKWFNKVAGWIRKKGRQKEKEFLNPYYLPDALKVKY